MINRLHSRERTESGVTLGGGTDAAHRSRSVVPPLLVEARVASEATVQKKSYDFERGTTDYSCRFKLGIRNVFVNRRLPASLLFFFGKFVFYFR